MQGRVHSIETLAAVDGPGLRMAIFLQGCPQRCIYCHNPDTWNPSGGEAVESEELVKKAVRYKPYFKNTGGVTVSGGEPFMQTEFVTELLKGLKRENIHTAVDTSGYYLDDGVKNALKYADLVLLDVKHAEAEKFSEITKAEYERISKFLEYMRETGKSVWIRQVIVPGYTDSDEQMEKLMELLRGVKVERVDLLPYHTLGVDKWKELKIPYALDGVKPPDNDTMKRLNEIVKRYYPNNRESE